jgi:hypothetical protein
VASIRKNVQEGVVRNLRRDQTPPMWSGDGSSPGHLLSFRLELSDERGEILGYLPVEIRGSEVIGDVAEGDKVAVPGRRSRQGILRSAGQHRKPERIRTSIVARYHG